MPCNEHEDEPSFSPFFDIHADDPDVGRTLGGYRLIRLIAHGGMGKVFLAERPDLGRRVAFKLARRSLRGEARRWFANEGKIHARLEHPNIARLYDAGTVEAADGDDAGRPFFAMEYVDGEPIDVYCEARGLDVRARLAIFRKVCAAVQHAHRQPIVHLDLKPSNVLITAGGEPRLLDFGIARLLSSENGLPGPGFDSSAMTFQYASPEQLRGEPVSVASDLYSLGVMLYKVLAGRLPYRVPPFAGLDDVRRLLCDTTPPPPSAAAGSPGRRRALAGDLDAVVLKTLAKKPAERYGSVQELDDDLGRYLEHRPLSAVGGGLAYYVGKLVRRRRLAVAAAVLLTTAMAGTAATVTVLWRRAEHALVRAERASQFLEDLIANAKPDASQGEDLTVRQLLERGRRRIPVDLVDEPELQIDMAGTFGEVLRDLGDHEASAELLEEALDVARRHYGGDHVEIVKRLNNVGASYYDQGDFAEAGRYFREALEMGDRLGQESSALFRMKDNLASVLMLQGTFDEAEGIYLDVLRERREAATEAADPNVATSLRNLGACYLNWRRPERAEPPLREALAIRLRLYGGDDTRVASVLDLMGGAAAELGRPQEAESFYTDSVRIGRQRFGDGHLRVAWTKTNLAELLLDEDPAAAEVLITQALAVYGRSRPGGWEMAAAESVLGAILLRQGRDSEAEPCLRTSWETLRRVRGEGSLVAEKARRRMAELTDPRRTN